MYECVAREHRLAVRPIDCIDSGLPFGPRSAPDCSMFSNSSLSRVSTSFSTGMQESALVFGDTFDVSEGGRIGGRYTASRSRHTDVCVSLTAHSHATRMLLLLATHMRLTCDSHSSCTGCGSDNMKAGSADAPNSDRQRCSLAKGTSWWRC